MASAEDVPSFLADVSERLVRYMSEAEHLEQVCNIFSGWVADSRYLQPVLRLRSPAEILSAFADSGAPLPITGGMF
jgi:hypothetical protein